MLVLGLLIGCAIGFMTACYGVHKMTIGTLRMVHDDYDGESYLYAELDRPYFPSYKRVVMRVDNSHK